jgi:hypothetical protein
MESLRIDILNPRARRILKELADLKLISIRDNPVKSFENLLVKLRSGQEKISLDEITREVELVRKKRYGKKA